MFWYVGFKKLNVIPPTSRKIFNSQYEHASGAFHRLAYLNENLQFQIVLPLNYCSLNSVGSGVLPFM